MGRIQTSRVQGLRGHSPGQGGEAKASPTTSFTCCLKLRFAKLEAPLRGAGADLTTARPVGRRVSISVAVAYPYKSMHLKSMVVSMSLGVSMSF